MVPPLYPKFWGWSFLYPKPEFPKICLKFPNCWGFSRFFHGLMKSLLNSVILGIVEAGMALVGKSQLPHSQISRLFIGEFFLGRVYSNLILQSHPPLEKNPGKYDSTEISGTKGKIWEKLQGNGEVEAGFHIQGKNYNSNIPCLNSRRKNSFLGGMNPTNAAFLFLFG